MAIKCKKNKGRLKKINVRFHQTLFLTLPIRFFQALAFVMLFLTLGQTDFHFDL